MGLLKQSTVRNRTFFLVQAVDHLTGATGAAPTVTISKNAGAFAGAAGAVTELSSGWYNVALTTVDTGTLGDLAFHVTGTGADPSDWSDEVSARITDDLSILDAAAIRTAIGLASANLDTQLAAISGFIDTEVAAILAAVDTEVAAIKAKTDQITFTIANKVDSSIQAAADFAQGAADKVWLTAARTLTAFGFSVTVGTNNDKTGYSLSAAGIQAIWDALTSALTTVGSIGKLLVDNINATISSRSTYAGADTAGTTTLLGRLTAGRATNLDNLDVASSVVASYIDTEIATLLTRVPGVVPTAAQISTQVAADAAITPLASNVKKINDVTVTGVGSSGNPWGP